MSPPDPSETIATRRSLSPRLQRLRNWYVGAAVIGWNTLLCYLLLNAALAFVFLVRDSGRTNPVSTTYGNRLDAVYPDLPEPARTQMLSESWNRPYQYADYIHFQESPSNGKYVKVSEHGFRHSANQGPWPPVPEHYNIFCFGGSTMFAYGLPDEQTLASCLQSEFQTHIKRHVCVYNFGVGWHFSTQERLRFEQLLAAGFIPDSALFLDGINDTSLAWANRPAFSDELAKSFRQVQAFGAQSPDQRTGPQTSTIADALFYQWPVGRLARGVSARLRPASSGTQPTKLVEIDAEKATQGCEVYRWNRTLIQAAATAKGVTPLFIVQPAPGYHSPPEKHLFANEQLCRNEALFYSVIKDDLEKHRPENHLIWCADLPESVPGPLYVDTCHYTAAFSKLIAKHIITECANRKLIRGGTTNNTN